MFEQKQRFPANCLTYCTRWVALDKPRRSWRGSTRQASRRIRPRRVCCCTIRHRTASSCAWQNRNVPKNRLTQQCPVRNLRDGVIKTSDVNMASDVFVLLQNLHHIPARRAADSPSAVDSAPAQIEIVNRCLVVRPARYRSHEQELVEHELTVVEVAFG